MDQEDYVGLASPDEIMRYKLGITRLTPREREVFRELVKCKTPQIIAYDLSIKKSTVQRHMTKILRTTGLHTPVELLIFANIFGIRPVWNTPSV